jgi:hypothetical protein
MSFIDESVSRTAAASDHAAENIRSPLNFSRSRVQRALSHAARENETKSLFRSRQNIRVNAAASVFVYLSADDHLSEKRERESERRGARERGEEFLAAM